MQFSIRNLSRQTNFLMQKDTKMVLIVLSCVLGIISLILAAIASTL